MANHNTLAREPGTSGKTPFASIRGAARLLDRNESTVRGYVEGARKVELKQAEVLSASGLQGARLFSEDQLLELIGHYKPTLLVEFAKLGMRLSLQRSVNFEMSSHSVMADIDKVVAKLLSPCHHSVTRFSGRCGEVHRGKSTQVHH